jgi:hypothetical protein
VASDVVARLEWRPAVVARQQRVRAGGVDWIALEAWQDSGVPVRVEGASLEIRSLAKADGAPIERC